MSFEIRSSILCRYHPNRTEKAYQKWYSQICVLYSWKCDRCIVSDTHSCSPEVAKHSIATYQSIAAAFSGRYQHLFTASLRSLDLRLTAFIGSTYLWEEGFSQMNITLVSNFFFHSLLKFRVIFVHLTLLNPNLPTKLPYHPPVLRERGLN